MKSKIKAILLIALISFITLVALLSFFGAKTSAKVVKVKAVTHVVKKAHASKRHRPCCCK